jgi:hypothetical protein
VDLTRDAGPFLRDGPAELRRADRPPHADEQDPVPEHAQELALRDLRARHERREYAMEPGEQEHAHPDREPEVEILALGPVAPDEADHGDEVAEREERQRADEGGGRPLAGHRGEPAEVVLEHVEDAPERREGERGRRDGAPQDRVAQGHAAARVGRRADEARAEEPAEHLGRRVACPDHPTAEGRDDPEEERARGRSHEAAREQEVLPAPLDAEADTGEDRDERRCEHDRGEQHEPQLRELVDGVEPGVRREEGE